MTQVWDMDFGNPIQKLVALKLADNANDSGVCWPSLSKIAQQCNCSTRSVSRHIEALSIMGLLSIGKSKGKHNVYKFTTMDGESLVTESLVTIDRESTHPRQRVTTPVTESLTNHKEPSKNHKEPSLGDGRKPSNLEEVINFFDDQLNIFNARPHAEKFYYHYEANGWTQGKGAKPLKKWGAAARTWKSNQRNWGYPLPEKPKQAEKAKPKTEQCKAVANDAIAKMKGLGI
jgi:predicted transcriptional regulator